MKKQLNELFISNWKKYFPEAGLPIAFFYTNKVTEEDLEDTVNEYRCLICNLNRVREGHTFVYSAKTSGCLGGKRYTGFSHKLRSNFEYFLSCGIPVRWRVSVTRNPQILSGLILKIILLSRRMPNISCSNDGTDLRRKRNHWSSSFSPCRTFYQDFSPWPIMMSLIRTGSSLLWDLVVLQS